jgi:hypothetical protein
VIESCVSLAYYVFTVYSVPRNLEPTYENATGMFCVVTSSFPGTSLAAAAA